MAHLSANNPGQQDAGEILLSGFTHMALQMEAQRRLMKPGSKPRRGKKGQKKQPQRGLGVAQLEKIRLEEQRRLSQHAQQLAALQQFHSGMPLFTNAPVPAPSFASASASASARIISQFERESNHSSVLPASTSSTLARLPTIDNIANSFLSNNVTPLSSIARPTAPVTTPLDLFPREKFAVASLTRASDRMWADRNFYLRHAPGEGRALIENPQGLLSLACDDQSSEGQDDDGLNWPFFRIRRNKTAIVDLRHSSQINQVPSSVASPSFNLERMMELSSFQSTPSLRGEEQATIKRRACGVVHLGGGSRLAELPMWTKPSLAYSKPSYEYQNHGRINVDVCELSLRPPGSVLMGPSVNMDRPNAPTVRQPSGRGPHNFLSLSVGATWQDIVTESSSSTPSPVSATTTKSSANDTSTDEYMSPTVTSWSCPTNFFTTKSSHAKELQVSLFSSCDISLDLTLKL